MSKYGIFENNNDNFYEAKFLNLNSQKSITNLNWNQKLDIHESIKKVSDWYKAHQDGKDMGKFTKKQIEDFLNV
jgi:dTDP-D-glucose 4,6-dehydratase